METLTLILKKEWFDMILSGEKKEEYRDLTLHYAKRFLDYSQAPEEEKGENRKIIPSDILFDIAQGFEAELVLKSYFTKFKKFDLISFVNGYSRKSRRFVVKFEGISIATGRENWGAKPMKEYFVIKFSPVESPLGTP